MPLFTYKCEQCEYEVEKFQHKSDEDLEIMCENCEDTVCVKQISCAKSKTILNAKDTYNEVIKPDAKRIQENISKGKDKDFFDIYGE